MGECAVWIPVHISKCSTILHAWLSPLSYLMCDVPAYFTVGMNSLLVPTNQDPPVLTVPMPVKTNCAVSKGNIPLFSFNLIFCDCSIPASYCQVTSFTYLHSIQSQPFNSSGSDIKNDSPFFTVLSANPCPYSDMYSNCPDMKEQIGCGNSQVASWCPASCKCSSQII